MKKIYVILAALGLFSAANAQEAFWDVVPYKGAFPITDGTPATDWTSGWSNFDAENTVYPATTSTVSTDITTNTTWSGVVLLQNKVYVKNNAILTIQPGTIIRGDLGTQATLIITRGAKINAIGTAAQPIVFTSNFGPGARQEGDWGGLVILGLAKNNQPGGVANIEGIVATTDTQHGGNFDTDNSGSLKYVRVEFAGIPLEPNKEINGITFGSVGSGTTIDYVQVSHSGDDSFEWFGGTVNCKHLIAYRGLDDDFDTDFGYRGRIQFGLIIRDKDLSDAPGDSNAFESDNDAAGSTAQPKTMPIFSNITIVGPKGDGSIVLPVGEKFEKAFRLRRNTSTSVLNSLVTGWEKGLSVEGASSEANVNGDSLVFISNNLSNFATAAKCVTATPAFYATFFGADGNDTITTNPQINWVNLFAPLGTTPDARLATGSTVGTGANFVHPKFYNLSAPTATASISYCQGTTASALAATAGVGNSLYWYTTATGGVGSMTAPIPSTTSAGTFNFWVSQYNANSDESPRTAIVVTVNATPATPTINASGATSFCTGGSVNLTASTASGNVWSTTATTQMITVSTTGNYTVTYTDGNGCSATSASTSVNVSNAPIPTINASSLSGCTGEDITLTASTADSYTWSNGATTQSIVVNTADVYTVTTTNADACDGVGTSDPVTITFTQSPTAAGSFSTVGNVVTFTNTSTDATTYSWDFGDFSNSSATAPSHAYAANGAYTVTLTAINGNCTDEITLNIQISVGIEELAGLVEVTLYPNPTNSNATIAIENENVQNASIMIVNQLGQIITSQEIELTNGSNSIELATNTFANGIYTVMLITETGRVTRKLIVQK
ncbi:MAG: T9SS type A sorting domain-containing protein [Bacteroidota bacterium]